MSLKLKYFTVEEAESLLPRVSEILNAARETKTHIEKKVEDWRKAHKSIGPAEEAVLRGQVDYLANHLEGQLSQISEMGCIPKDLDMGLIDFPARIENKEGYLCWMSGEKNITHWHGLTEGFNGRKPIKG